MFDTVTSWVELTKVCEELSLAAIAETWGAKLVTIGANGGRNDDNQ
jgi:hypothetical protein